MVIAKSNLSECSRGYQVPSLSFCIQVEMQQLEDDECKLNPALLGINQNVEYWIAASSLSHPYTKLTAYKLWNRSSDVTLPFCIIGGI